MLTWVEAKRWRVAVLAVLGLALATAGVWTLADSIRDKTAADKALQAAAGQTQPTGSDDQPTPAAAPIETTDPYVERAVRFAEQAFTWRIDTYAQTRAEALAWAGDDQGAADIEAMLPDAIPQVHSAGGAVAAWRIGANEVRLRLRQTVVRPIESDNVRGAADHLIAVQLDERGKVTGLSVVYARGEVS
ncbi:MAG: hypothetical protein LBG60_13085 [Bifidobacteriaceae bacterium]|jgi:hypothetical protein|nr:hypothetical protein [Bifidobacteriaceae bacterium]